LWGANTHPEDKLGLTDRGPLPASRPEADALKRFSDSVAK